VHAELIGGGAHLVRISETRGPEPRRAPDNKICFSGAGNYALTNGKGGGTMQRDENPHAPGTLYASTLGHGSCCPLMGGGGLYASQNASGTWNPIMNGLIDLNVLAIVADPSTAGVLYADTKRGVFSSNDGGGVVERARLRTP